MLLWGKKKLLFRICEHSSVLTWISGLFLHYLGDLRSLEPKFLIYNDPGMSAWQKQKQIPPVKNHPPRGHPPTSVRRLLVAAMAVTSGIQRKEEWWFQGEWALHVCLRCCHVYVFITCVHSPRYCCRNFPLYNNGTVYFSIFLLRNIWAGFRVALFVVVFF